MNKLLIASVDEIKNIKLPLSVEEHILLYKNCNQAKESRIGYELLDQGLKELGIDSYEIDFTSKPYIKNNNGIMFNISHDSNMAVCVISNKEIGVDIMKIRSIDEKIINRILNKNELMPITDYDKTILWCKKEAYIKYKGTSISSYMDKIDTTKIKYETIEKNGYIIVVCYDTI